MRALAHLPERVSATADGLHRGLLFSCGLDSAVRIWRVGMDAVHAGDGALAHRWSATAHGSFVPPSAEGELHALLLGGGSDAHGAWSATEDDANGGARPCWLACGADSGIIYVWQLGDAGQAQTRPLCLEGHTAAVLELVALAAAPPTPASPAAPGGAPGERIASASKDRSIRIWAVDRAGGSGVPLCCLGPRTGPPFAHRDVVRALAFVGGLIYSTGRDKTLRLWQGSGTDSWLCARSLAAHTDEVLALASEPRGAWPRRVPHLRRRGWDRQTRARRAREAQRRWRGAATDGLVHTEPTVR